MQLITVFKDYINVIIVASLYNKILPKDVIKLPKDVTIIT